MQRIMIVDDFDHNSEARPCTFSLNDETWDIDLSDDHIIDLATVLAPFAKAGRKRPVAGAKNTPTRRQRKAAIRRWANAQQKYADMKGYPFSATVCGGYIPTRVIRDYEERELT